MDKFPEHPSVFETYMNYTINALESDRSHSEIQIMTHQLEALRSIKDFFKNETRHGLVVMPTGTGKSLIVLLAPYFLGVKKKVLVVTPSKVISRQLLEDGTGTNKRKSIYERLGIVDQKKKNKYLPSVVIQENKNLAINDAQQIIIANAQKFSNKCKTLRDGILNEEFFPEDAFDLVIVDEAHHYPSNTWKRIIAHYRDKNVLFLTATPYRENVHMVDNDNIVADITEIFRFPRSVAVERNVIRSLEWISVSNIDSSNEIEDVLSQFLNGHPENNDGVFMHQAMALTQSIYCCKKWIERFKGCNINAKPYHGIKLEGNLRDFIAGKIQLLVVCGKLLEGFDHPKVRVCAFLYETKSFIRYSQFAGRCIRIDRNNPHLVNGILIGPEELDNFFNRLLNEENEDLPTEDPDDDE